MGTSQKYLSTLSSFQFSTSVEFLATIFFHFWPHILSPVTIHVVSASHIIVHRKHRIYNINHVIRSERRPFMSIYILGIDFLNCCNLKLIHWNLVKATLWGKDSFSIERYRNDDFVYRLISEVCRSIFYNDFKSTWI